MAGALASVVFVENSTNRFDFLRQPETISACVNVGETESIATNMYNEADRVGFCYRKIYSQSLLDEFHVRRIVFQTQNISDVTLLWMVVFITTSGVVLSGVQLYTSYQLALSGGADGSANQSLEIERGKLSLKSSVTGLFILVFSLAFFYLYIVFVYTIDDPSRKTGRDQLDIHRSPGEASASTFAGEFYASPGTIPPVVPPQQADPSEAVPSTPTP